MNPPQQILTVLRRLGPLADRAIFVGGMIRRLLSTDPAAGPARPTLDVDLIIDVESLAAYHSLGEDLRRSGFSEDTSDGAPLCRWVVEGVTADVMPINPIVLGFTNVWYESAPNHALNTETEHGILRHLDAPHFCATKLEAFASRGDGDHYHHDIEDFLAVVDERAELIGELEGSPKPVREFVSEYVSKLMRDSSFVEALAGHLASDEASQRRLPVLRQRLASIAALSETSRESPAPSQHVIPLSRTSEAAEAKKYRSDQVSATSRASSGRYYVQSSNLEWVEYNAAANTLHIGFKGGREYLYADVPAPIVDGLFGAYSKGRYFHRWIRNRYRTTRMS